jgi:hypothetical protein
VAQADIASIAMEPDAVVVLDGKAPPDSSLRVDGSGRILELTSDREMVADVIFSGMAKSASIDGISHPVFVISYDECMRLPHRDRCASGPSVRERVRHLVPGGSTTISLP